MEIIIHTYAYNAAKTIRRTIDSILAQSYHDWIYYVVDNGSTDKTGEIIKEYANNDARIIPLVNEENNVWKAGNSWRDIMDRSNDDDYFCWLDADDAYMPDFLSDMLSFIHKYNLDIAACGSQFYTAETDQQMDKSYSISSDIIITKDGFAKYFRTYLPFMWTYWGKLYSLSLFHDFSMNDFRVSYGWDTIYTMKAFSRAKRVGILGGTLHKYYISNQSHSYQYNNLRVLSDQICCDVGLDYLRKQKASTTENQNLIYGTYSNAIRNTLILLRNAEIDPLEKLKGICDIFTHKHTQTILNLKKETDSFLLELQYQAQKYIFSLPQARNGVGLEYAAAIIASMRDLPETFDLDTWRDSEAFDFLIKLRLKCTEIRRISAIDQQIEQRISKTALLIDVPAPFAAYIQSVISAVLHGDLRAALEKVFLLLEREIPDDYAEGLVTLALNLAAMTDNSSAFLFFKKVWISYLLDCLRFVEARVLLDEYEEILPDDEDLVEMRKRLQ